MFSANSLLGYHLHATDGEIGSLHDIYFDDESWAIRYFVVDTGDWLPDKKVLVSPGFIGLPDEEREILPVSLAKNELENCPERDSEKPVSRQHDESLLEPRIWQTYWIGGYYPVAGTGMSLPIVPVFEDRNRLDVDPAKCIGDGDPHLRSIDAVTGYSAVSTDSRRWYVDDFVIDCNIWKIKYITVARGKWFAEKKVQIPVELIREVSWDDFSVFISLSDEAFEQSPEFEPSRHMNLL